MWDLAGLQAVARDCVAAVTRLAKGAADGAALEGPDGAHAGAAVVTGAGPAAEKGPVERVKRARLARVAAPVALRALGLVLGADGPEGVAACY